MKNIAVVILVEMHESYLTVREHGGFRNSQERTA